MFFYNYNLKLHLKLEHFNGGKKKKKTYMEPMNLEYQPPPGGKGRAHACSKQHKPGAVRQAFCQVKRAAEAGRFRTLKIKFTWNIMWGL